MAGWSGFGSGLFGSAQAAGGLAHLAATVAGGLFSVTTGALAASLVAYSGYVIYDTAYVEHQAYAAAADLAAYRPTIIEDEAVPLTGVSLSSINEDYRAWLVMDDTKIDYPVMQGENDLYYVSHDVYRNSSLSGAIYFAAANSPDLSDSYNLVYGHHMDNGAMFGGLDAYCDADYFNSHRTGTLVSADKVYDLRVFAAAKTDAYEWDIYDAGDRMDDVLSHLQNPSDKTQTLFYDAAALGNARQIIALSTCASADTNGRLVVFAAMTLRGSTPDSLYSNLDRDTESRRTPTGTPKNVLGTSGVGAPSDGDGADTPADGTEAVPDGTETPSDGLPADGTGMSPGGTSSDGTGTSPGGGASSDGTGTSPGGTSSDGTGTSPGGGTSSDGTGASPGGGASSDGTGRYSDGASAGGTGTYPDGTPSDGAGRLPNGTPLEGTGTLIEGFDAFGGSEGVPWDTGSDEGGDEPLIDIQDLLTPLSEWVDQFQPAGGSYNGRAWALMNLVALAYTLYLLFPLTYAKAKFFRAGTMKKINRAKEALFDAEELNERELLERTMIEREAVEDKARADGADVETALREAEAASFADVTEEEFTAAADKLYYQVKQFLRRFRVGVCAELLVAALAAVAFFLTEDMRLPMALIDKWTPLMLAFLAVCWVVDIRLARYRGDMLCEDRRRREKAERVPAQ